MLKFIKYFFIIAAILVVVAYFLQPTQISMPVQGATSASYNHQSFWCPWGDHHHHGVDIFAQKGTPIHPARAGVVIAVTRNLGNGGNTVSILDCSGTVYYYAHMDSITTTFGSIVTTDSNIGTVGKTGNAAKTPAHLHFAVLSFWPKTHEPSKYDETHYSDDGIKWLFHNPIKLMNKN